MSECLRLQEYTDVWSSMCGQLPDPLHVKQSFWDQLDVESDPVSVEASLENILQLRTSGLMVIPD